MHIIWLVLILTLFLYYVSSSGSNNPSEYQYPAGSLACKTHNMTEMDCSNRYLVEIPFLDQNFTTILDLSYNKLTEIKGAPFEQLPHLWTLNLSHNEITHNYLLQHSGEFGFLYTVGFTVQKYGSHATRHLLQFNKTYKHPPV